MDHSKGNTNFPVEDECVADSLVVDLSTEHEPVPGNAIRRSTLEQSVGKSAAGLPNNADISNVMPIPTTECMKEKSKAKRKTDEKQKAVLQEGPIIECKKTKSKRKKKKTGRKQTTESQDETAANGKATEDRDRTEGQLGNNDTQADSCIEHDDALTKDSCLKTVDTEIYVLTAAKGSTAHDREMTAGEQQDNNDTRVKNSSPSSNECRMVHDDVLPKDPCQANLDTERLEGPITEGKKKKSRRKKKRSNIEKTAELQEETAANGKATEDRDRTEGQLGNNDTQDETAANGKTTQDRETTEEQLGNNDIQVDNSSPSSNECRMVHDDVLPKDPSQQTLDTERHEEPITERKKKKSRRKKKKTNVEKTAELQDESAYNGKTTEDRETTEVQLGNIDTQAESFNPTSIVCCIEHDDVLPKDPCQATLDSETQEEPITEISSRKKKTIDSKQMDKSQEETASISMPIRDRELTGEQQSNTATRMMTYADCVKTGKRKTPKRNRVRIDTTEQFPLSGRLYSTTADSDVESIFSFKFDEEEDDFDDSDLEVTEEEDIGIGDNIETWFEKSCSKYDCQENVSEDDILDKNVLTDGVELTDAYMEKFTRNSDSLKREDLYSLRSASECHALCRTKPDLYVCCKLEIQSSHRAVATLLKPRPKLETIEILGRSKCGQAFTEDEVVVEILQKKNYEKETSVIKRGNKDADAYGKVIAIIERVRHKDIEHPVFIATQDPRAGHLMLPVCKTIPKISVLNENIKQRFPKQRMHKVEVYEYIESKGLLRYQKIQDIKPEERDQYRFLVCYLHWGKKYVYPRGAIIGVVRTNVTDIATGLKIIGIQNQVPFLYNESTVREVQRIIDEHREPANGSRDDLTDSVVAFTIDPPFSKDLDDALSVKVLSSDTFLVGVHISDVTAKIPLNSDVDKEARLRCSTYYSIPEARALHMLPEPLSQDILSLLPNKKRATISIFFTMKENGSIERAPVIRRTLIQSRKRLTYQEAQAIIDTTVPSPDFVHQNIKCLNNLAQNRRRERLKGALHAFPVEFDYSIEADNILQNIGAHNLVEEFMIMANYTVGQCLMEKCGGVVPLRCQDDPENDALSSWLKKNTHLADIIIALQDRKLNTSSTTKTLNIENVPPSRWNRLLPIQTWVWKAIVDAAQRHDIERVKQLLGSDDLHPQQSFALQEWMSFQETARYKCAGSIEQLDKGGHHFSLGLNNYVHFTSPIRRYVDIVIHRLLHAAMDGLDTLPYTEAEVVDICNDMNQANQRSKAYQKQCNMLLLSTKLRRCPQKLVGFVEDMSDEGVTLHFPGLKHVPMQKRMLRFNLLDVSSQPQTREDLDLIPPNTSEKRELTSVMWQRRMYLHKGFNKKPQKTENKEDDGSTVHSIDPHQRTTFLKYTAWLEILTALLDKKYNDLIDQIKDTEHDVGFGALHKYVKSYINAVQYVSCENPTSVFVNPTCRFKLPFHLNQTVAVQMTADYDRGTLFPYIQVFDMTPNMSFCLQHVDNPVKFLARYSTVPSQLVYKSVQKYILTWIPIIQMEAATNAVRNEESATVSGMPMQFRGRQGKFYLNIHYCRVREIEFGNTALEIFKEDNEDDARDNPVKDVKLKGELKEIMCSNYLCIRCPVVKNIQKNHSRSAQGRIFDENMTWIGHGEFTHMRKRKIDKCGHCFEVHFRIRNDNAPAPMKVADISDGCIMEILMKSKVDRRTENLMKLLPEATCLAQSIALAKRIPELSELHDEIAKEIPRDVEVGALPKNNHQQRKAIENALTSRFSLIQGPPGTGKTFTGVKLIYLFSLFNQRYYERTHERRHLVYSGPSNKSVDLVAKQVLQRLSEHAPRIIRMYGQAYEQLDFPVPGKIRCSHRTLRDAKPDDDLKENGVVLHHVIREDWKPYAAELKTFDERFRNGSYTASIEEIDKYQDILSKATQEELKNYDVILCTTSMAGNPKLLKATKGKVYQCIIDECGMCTEPECMVPLIATRAEQVVLIGDHKQLQPIILCKEAGEMGLETSMFERYAKLKKKMEKLNMKYTMLVWQYRMNPKICEFPSEKFYDGKLKTALSEYWMVEKPLRIWKKKSCDEHVPLAFCHIEGSEEVLTVSTAEGNERSRKNKEEVEQVVRVFKHLIDVEKVKINHIKIITQYNAQRHAIQTALVEGERIINTKINTVVKSQGSEWNYVIFSTVRSLPRYLIESHPTIGWCHQNLGFITDQHQINVALTRARRGLIIIGNKHLLRCDEVWRDLINKYESEGLVYSRQQFPPSRHHPSGQQPRPPRLQHRHAKNNHSY